MFLETKVMRSYLKRELSIAVAGGNVHWVKDLKAVQSEESSDVQTKCLLDVVEDADAYTLIANKAFIPVLLGTFSTILVAIVEQTLEGITCIFCPLRLMTFWTYQRVYFVGLE